MGDTLGNNFRHRSGPGIDILLELTGPVASAVPLPLITFTLLRQFLSFGPDRAGLTKVGARR